MCALVVSSVTCSLSIRSVEYFVGYGSAHRRTGRSVGYIFVSLSGCIVGRRAGYVDMTTRVGHGMGIIDNTNICCGN